MTFFLHVLRSVVVHDFDLVGIVIPPDNADPYWWLMRMLCCPCRPPLSFAGQFPGGIADLPLPAWRTVAVLYSFAK